MIALRLLFNDQSNRDKQRLNTRQKNAIVFLFIAFSLYKENQWVVNVFQTGQQYEMFVYKSIGLRIKQKQANIIKLVSQFILVLSNNLQPGPIVVSDPPPPSTWGIELRNAILVAGYMM